MSRMHHVAWFRISIGLAVLSAIAAAFALLEPDWIERALDVAPDGGDGSAEWGWALGFGLASVAFGLFANRLRTWPSARNPRARSHDRR